MIRSTTLRNKNISKIKDKINWRRVEELIANKIAENVKIKILADLDDNDDDYEEELSEDKLNEFINEWNYNIKEFFINRRNNKIVI